jgi:hypothetical protein
MKKLYQFTLILIWLSAAVLEIGGCQRSSDGARRHADSLLVAPLAVNPKYSAYPDGREQLTYTIDTEYPAEQTISFISAELQKRRWEPLREDFLNPGIPSSQMRGWTQFEDASREPIATVRQWACDWEDGAHNITIYDLKYRYALSGTRDATDSRALQVLALYIPVAIAENMKHVTKPDQPRTQSR